MRVGGVSGIDEFAGSLEGVHGRHRNRCQPHGKPQIRDSLLKRFSRVNPTSSSPALVPSDCQTCGVCCFSPSDEYVWVTGYDWERLGADAERLAHFIGNRAFMKMVGGHCAALEIRSGHAARFYCGIYERRPEICRRLERGSPECLGELETKVARPNP
jgi:hypothetical protein